MAGVIFIRITMKYKLGLILLACSLQSMAGDVAPSMLDVEFGKKLPFPLTMPDIKPRDSYYKSFRIAQNSGAEFSQFYDYEVRTSSDLIVYSVKGIRAYPSSKKCNSENDKVNRYFSSSSDYDFSREHFISFKSKNDNKYVSINCFTQEGSPSWALKVEIYDHKLKERFERR